MERFLIELFKHGHYVLAISLICLALFFKVLPQIDRGKMLISLLLCTSVVIISYYTPIRRPNHPSHPPPPPIKLPNTKLTANQCLEIQMPPINSTRRFQALITNNEMCYKFKMRKSQELFLRLGQNQRAILATLENKIIVPEPVDSGIRYRADSYAYYYLILKGTGNVTIILNPRLSNLYDVGSKTF